MHDTDLASTLADAIGLEDGQAIEYLRAELPGLRCQSDNLKTLGAAGSPSKRVATFASLERACAYILRPFGVEESDIDVDRAIAHSVTSSIWSFQVAQIVHPARYHHAPQEDEQSTAKLGEWLRGVVALREAARRARRQAEDQKGEGRGGKRREEEWGRKEAAWHLLRLYYEVTGRRPRVGGPAIRFLDAALRERSAHARSVDRPNPAPPAAPAQASL